MSLFPENVVDFGPESSPYHTVILATQTTSLMTRRCALHVSHVPLIYTTLQAGVGCAFASGELNAVAVELLAEGALRQNGRHRQIRPGALPALRHTFELASSDLPGNEYRVLSMASVAYKVVPRETRKAEEDFARPIYNPFYIQRWADVLESNYTIGVVTFLPFRERAEAMGIRFQYLETLPVGLRRWGGLAETASTQYKQLDVSARFDFSGFIAGGGLGYAILTFDGVRAGLPLPSVNFGFLF